MTIEHMILSQLLYNEEYTRSVLPFLRSSYFQDPVEKVLFKTYVEFWQKYNVAPTKESISLEISNRKEISDTQFDEALDLVEMLEDSEPNQDWLMDTTEAWCQDNAIYNAITNSVAIIDGEDKKRTRHAIPDLLKEALSVSFKTEIGHDYIQDAEDRFKFYGEEFARIPFGLKILDLITNGGVPDGTLNVILAGTNVGKTLSLIHFTSSYLMQGKNVLYITLEMAEEEIARRVDANIFGVDINDVERMDEGLFKDGINKLRMKTAGKLIIKQYPTGSGHVGHFRQLLQELWLKLSFKPDVIMIDYIGIAASSRVSLGNTNSYFYVKAVAEEFRGLGIEFECPVWTAVQATRGGYANSDMDITDTAESFGLPATADLFLGAIRTPDLDELGQIKFKQLKNRYGDKNFKETFTIGVDAPKQRLYSVEQSAQSNVSAREDDEDKPSYNRRRQKNKSTKDGNFT